MVFQTIVTCEAAPVPGVPFMGLGQIGQVFRFHAKAEVTRLGYHLLPRDTAWAMSQENVEVVRKAIAYEYYGVGDRAEAAAIFDPEVVLNPIDEEPSSGFDAMRADMERWASAFDELKVTVEEIIDAGDQVVVVAHHEGRGLPGRSRFR
jgi:hypothetical protein